MERQALRISYEALHWIIADFLARRSNYMETGIQAVVGDPLTRSLLIYFDETGGATEGEQARFLENISRWSFKYETPMESDKEW
jgi:hypothetical protein